MRKSLPAVSDGTSQSLCQSCALCCDGTLFSKVPLDPAEAGILPNLGFDVVAAEHPAHFTQPCVKLVDSSCSVYAERPKNCRAYRCRILRRLENGELSAGEAQALVNKVKSLASTASELLASIGDRSSGLCARLEELAKRENLKLEDSEFSRRHSLLGMHIIMLRHLLDEEFTRKKPPGDLI